MNQIRSLDLNSPPHLHKARTFSRDLLRSLHEFFQITLSVPDHFYAGKKGGRREEGEGNHYEKIMSTWLTKPQCKGIIGRLQYTRRIELETGT